MSDSAPSYPLNFYTKSPYGYFLVEDYRKIVRELSRRYTIEGKDRLYIGVYLDHPNGFDRENGPIETPPSCYFPIDLLGQDYCVVEELMFVNAIPTIPRALYENLTLDGIKFTAHPSMSKASSARYIQAAREAMAEDAKYAAGILLNEPPRTRHPLERYRLKGGKEVIAYALSTCGIEAIFTTISKEGISIDGKGQFAFSIALNTWEAAKEVASTRSLETEDYLYLATKLLVEMADCEHVNHFRIKACHAVERWYVDGRVGQLRVPNGERYLPDNAQYADHVWLFELVATSEISQEELAIIESIRDWKQTLLKQ